VNTAARLAVVAACAGAVWLACDNVDVHIFVAAQYLPSLDCVTPGYAIDVLDGPPVDASCEATCVVPPFDSGVYVTTACAPFPPGDDVTGKNALCKPALAASLRLDHCLDGGPSNPLVVDAGHDAPDGKAADAADAKPPNAVKDAKAD
jgi:hypothetical protein